MIVGLQRLSDARFGEIHELLGRLIKHVDQLRTRYIAAQVARIDTQSAGRDADIAERRYQLLDDPLLAEAA
jgi:hypothetical protein